MFLKNLEIRTSAFPTRFTLESRNLSSDKIKKYELILEALNRMNKPDKLLINNKITIKECFNKLNKTQEKLLIVINKSKNFIGVINDGDIRRALLNGANLRFYR